VYGDDHQRKEGRRLSRAKGRTEDGLVIMKEGRKKGCQGRMEEGKEGRKEL
jgi:hypothetical protein